MADKKITELPAATVPLAGTEKAEIVQGGVNKQVDVSEFGAGTITSVNGDTGPVVVLDAADVGADPAGSAAAAQAAAAALLAAKVIYKEWQITDDVTAIGASTTVPKKTFYLPSAVTVDSLLFSLTTAQASGATFTIDIHVNGTTIFSTKPTIDNTENLSSDATPSVMSDNTWAQYAKVEVFVDQIGNGSAIELIMYTGWH